MKYRDFANTGMTTSVVGLGCNGFGSRIHRGLSEAVVREAIELGVNFFDTADIYGNQGSAEDILGNAILNVRASVFIATKFGRARNIEKKPGNISGFIEASIDASLRRLRTDYVDLYQLHSPSDVDDMGQVLHTLDALIRLGKIRFIGCCNATAAQLQEFDEIAQAIGCKSFVSTQEECNILRHPSIESWGELTPTSGRALIPFLPLAGGVLTGKYMGGKVPPPNSRLEKSTNTSSRYLSRNNRIVVDKLHHYAQARGRTLLELAVGFLLAYKAIPTVITGARSREQIAMNVDASRRWEITDSERAEVNEICISPDYF